MVLEHYNRLQLCEVTSVAEILRTHDLDCLLRNQVRIFKYTGTEEVGEKLLCRKLESCTSALFAEFLAPHLVSLKYGTLVVVASELVYACFENLIVTLCHTLALHAPRLSTVDSDMDYISGYTPVRADYTLIFIGVNEKVLNYVFAETVTYIIWIDAA